MAHDEQRWYCEAVKEQFPQHFFARRVLDVGSLDLNGNNRHLFTDCNYIGLDLKEGPNVDVICRCHKYKDEIFDTIICTECLEHDVFWNKSIRNMCGKLLIPGGLLLITCATTGRPEHGTTEHDPGSSPATLDYYRNITEEDLRLHVDFDSIFEQYEFSVEENHFDLRFWGIKKS